MEKGNMHYSLFHLALRCFLGGQMLTGLSKKHQNPDVNVSKEFTKKEGTVSCSHSVPNLHRCQILVPLILKTMGQAWKVPR